MAITMEGEKPMKNSEIYFEELKPRVTFPYPKAQKWEIEETDEP